MRPKIEPLSISSDTPSTAFTPPKWRWRLSSLSSTRCSIRPRPPARADDREAATAHDPLRPEDDHCDQDRATDHVAWIEVGDAHDLRQRCQEQRPDHWPQHVARAAEHCEREDLHRARDAVLVGIDEEVEVRLEPTGESGEQRAQDERDHLVARNVDALAQSSHLVLADRGPGAAEAAS